MYQQPLAIKCTRNPGLWKENSCINLYSPLLAVSGFFPEQKTGPHQLPEMFLSPLKKRAAQLSGYSEYCSQLPSSHFSTSAALWVLLCRHFHQPAHSNMATSAPLVSMRTSEKAAPLPGTKDW